MSESGILVAIILSKILNLDQEELVRDLAAYQQSRPMPEPEPQPESEAGYEMEDKIHLPYPLPEYDVARYPPPYWGNNPVRSAFGRVSPPTPERYFHVRFPRGKKSMWFELPLLPLLDDWYGKWTLMPEDQGLNDSIIQIDHETFPSEQLSRWKITVQNEDSLRETPQLLKMISAKYPHHYGDLHQRDIRLTMRICTEDEPGPEGDKFRVEHTQYLVDELIHETTKQDNEDKVSEMLQRKEYVEGDLINGKDENDWTALNTAVFVINPGMVNLLLVKGADPTIKSNGKTALGWAKNDTDSNMEEVLKILRGATSQ